MTDHGNLYGAIDFYEAAKMIALGEEAADTAVGEIKKLMAVEQIA